MSKAEPLVKKYGIKVSHQLYSEWGNFYALITGYPCALLDRTGYIIINDESYLTKLGVSVGARLNVPSRIATLPGYELFPRVIEDTQPTCDEKLLEDRAFLLRARGKVERPKLEPVKPTVVKVREVEAFLRSIEVRAWVLQEANGTCELCVKPGPFTLPNGERFLEVHHVKFLSKLGPDIVENAVALCPNCHRFLHYAEDAKNGKDRLYKQVKRLIRFK